MLSRWGIGLAAAAGLAGAAGVALAAVAAHRIQTPGLAAAAEMLQVHAVAALAIAALAARAELPTLWLAAATVVLSGSVLFAAAIALPPLAGVSLFPMAAPTGGSATIAGWLIVSVAAVREWLRRPG